MAQICARLLPLRAGLVSLLARGRHLRRRAAGRRLQPHELEPQLRESLFGVASLRFHRARLVRVRVRLVRLRGVSLTRTLKLTLTSARLFLRGIGRRLRRSRFELTWLGLGIGLG